MIGAQGNIADQETAEGLVDLAIIMADAGWGAV